MLISLRREGERAPVGASVAPAGLRQSDTRLVWVPHVRHETPRSHYAQGRRGGGMAALGTVGSRSCRPSDFLE